MRVRSPVQWATHAMPVFIHGWGDLPPADSWVAHPSEFLPAFIYANSRNTIMMIASRREAIFKPSYPRMQEKETKRGQAPRQQAGRGSSIALYHHPPPTRGDHRLFNKFKKFCKKDIKFNKFKENISALSTVSSYYIFTARKEPSWSDMPFLSPLHQSQ